MAGRMTRWWLSLAVGYGALMGAAVAAAQPSDDPYGPTPAPPAATPTVAPPVAPVPPATRPPARQPEPPAAAPAPTSRGLAPLPPHSVPDPQPAARVDEHGTPANAEPLPHESEDETEAGAGVEDVAPTNGARSGHGETGEVHEGTGHEGTGHEGTGHDAAAGHGEGDEAHGGGHHEAPGEINWAQGFWAERDHGPYGLLFRPEGTPPPLLALLLNTAIVFIVLYVFGRGPIQQALQQRRATILKGMQEAAKMKAEAEVRLRVYEQRLERLDDELETLKQQMREQAEIERQRVLGEARTRRERMEQEARRMVELELKAAREELHAASVRQAIAAAREVLTRELGAGDERRLVQLHVADLATAELGGAR